jgi:ATP-dependent RNA helicase DeaD
MRQFEETAHRRARSHAQRIGADMSLAAAHPTLHRALEDRGYTVATPVQTAVLRADSTRQDLLVSAQTGSGKTVAYGLALASTLLGEAERFEPRKNPLALVVAPTRELALQIQRELDWLFTHAATRIASCVGGMDIRREERALAAGAHIVVGTPGRLCDHLDRGNLDLSELLAVVLDEADEMLDMGFREDLERILDGTPENRRTMLFSATIPRAIVALARRYQRDAVRIATSAEDEPHGDIDFRAFAIAPRDREHAVVNMLRFFEVRGALIFCSTREAVKQLHGNLLERGFSAVALSGELSQGDRVRALQALRDGRARVCVATDVAARGLDLPDLGLVIHADLPSDRQTFLHRSGRTGRAGKKGICALLVSYLVRRHAERLLAAAKIDAVWSPPPSASEVHARDRQRLLREIADATADSTEEDRIVARTLLAERSAEELAAALVRHHRLQLPAPEELSESLSMRPPPPLDRGMGAREMAQFRMNVGRADNADPRWLIPLICRRGHVAKADIGRIRIMNDETDFEIAIEVADRFEAAARHPDARDREVRIKRQQPERERPGRRSRLERPRREAKVGARRGRSDNRKK